MQQQSENMCQVTRYFLVIVCFCSHTCFSYGACVKSLRWDDDPPFTFLSEHQKPKVVGVSVDIVKQVLTTLDCDLQLLKMPWARALEELKQGRVDIVGGMFITDDRRAFAHFSTVGQMSPNILFLHHSLQPDVPFSSLQEVLDHGLKLGAQINVNYGETFISLAQKSRYQHQFQYVSDRKLLWKMASVNRVNGVIADEFSGRYELSKLGLDDLVYPSSVVISDTPSYFAFSKQTNKVEFVQQFDVLSNLITQGEVKRIRDNYLRRDVN